MPGDLVDVEWKDVSRCLPLQAAIGRYREATDAVAEAEALDALGQFRLIVPLEVVEALRVLMPDFP
jgi:hypothetical protein